MSPGPWWLPLVVAGIGFLGLLISQWIVAWRDSSKVKTEGQRELARLAHDDRKDWRSERLKTYSEFEVSATHWRNSLILVAALFEAQKGIRTEAKDLLSDQYREVLRMLVRVKLVASAPVVQVAQELFDNLKPLHDELTAASYPDLGISREPDSAKVASTSDLAISQQRTMSRLLEAFRQDLGTAEVKSPATRLSPSPPSSPTS